MIGWKPAVIFAAGVENRFADVRLVDRRRVSPLWSVDGLAEQTVRAPARGPARPADDRCCRRGRRTASAPADASDPSGRAAAQPRLVLARLHDDDLTDHPRMLRAAVLGAEQVVASRLRRLEPEAACSGRACTSALMRNAGTNTSWMTSSDVMISFTGRPTGTCSSLISRWPSRCWNFHIHCLPTT